MVRVTLYWGGSALVGLESLGHSGSAPRGQDVVCAAVSALVHGLLLGLSEVAEVRDLRCEADPDVPLIWVSWPEEVADSLDLLTRTVALSLKEIESGYPGYVSITEVQR
ncbi:ribosomal-processing cysteine protease Prp [uncultured Fretibacterium sp.]|uniref:ribosomal-processing cysteine protease Prp n=1 Tax=uncultured Fretibacterium sp. TaxID=1678694 RepID=UPI002630FBCF|nr:ribosomal-processing cysteine protease Prp [uncultured Fretibacterium sp.]